MSNRFWEKGNVASQCVFKSCTKRSVAVFHQLQETLNWPPIVFKVTPFTSADHSFSRCEEIATSKQQLFVCAETSVEKLTPRIQQHSCQCQKTASENLAAENVGPRCHFHPQFSVTTVTSCCGPHHPIRLGTKYLADSRMGDTAVLFQAFQAPACVRSCWHRKTATDAFLSEFFKNYKECVKTLADESCVDALYKEIVSYPEMDGINILTDDARHGTTEEELQIHGRRLHWRRKLHGVLRVETVTPGLMCHVLRSMNC